MDSIIQAMTQTAKGVLYDCKHIKTISKLHNDESYDKSFRRILTRQQRYPYVMLWVIIISVSLLVVVLLCILFIVSRKVHHIGEQAQRRYYFDSM